MGQIDPAFLDTPQFVEPWLSAEFGREIVVKVETLNPIGSSKGRGTSLLARSLDPTCTWVCATAGNFGQGLAYAARTRQATVNAFVGPDVSPRKVARMRLLGARVEVCERPTDPARDHAADEGRVLVIDGLDPTMAEGAGDTD